VLCFCNKLLVLIKTQVVTNKNWLKRYQIKLCLSAFDETSEAEYSTTTISYLYVQWPNICTGK